MVPPLVSFVVWNRMGLTARNLPALLNTTDDFELYIADNNSQDDTWQFLQELHDPRIKSKARFDLNRGQIYTVNYHLSHRKKDQYFITVDSDVNIYTSNWVTRFLKVFDEFPEVGLLGAVSSEYYTRYQQTLLKRQKGELYYLQLCKGFVEGCCQCIRPEVLNILGYWNEENCMGDVEMSYRICNYTSYKVGFIPDVEIDQLQNIACEECTAKNCCHLAPEGKNCFHLRNEKYRNPQFRNLYKWKYEQWLKEMNTGKRTAYCASIHDGDSRDKGRYNRHMAEENFKYYIDNTN